jgi:hypothetical protein
MSTLVDGSRTTYRTTATRLSQARALLGSGKTDLQLYSVGVLENRCESGSDLAQALRYRFVIVTGRPLWPGKTKEFAMIQHTETPSQGTTGLGEKTTKLLGTERNRAILARLLGAAAHLHVASEASFRDDHPEKTGRPRPV